MPAYVLPDLEYDFGALEPHISGQIMELHHNGHHKAYVEKANQTLEQLAEARDKTDFSKIAGLEKSLAFNLSGHVLHSIFWKNLAPRAGATARPGTAILLPAPILQARPCKPAPGPEDLRSGPPAWDEGAKQWLRPKDSSPGRPSRRSACASAARRPTTK